MDFTQVIDVVRSTLSEVSRLYQSNSPLEEGMTRAHLEGAQRQLEIMIAQLESGELPSKEKRARGMAHSVVDSWPMDNKLGRKIIEAEQSYLRL